MAPADIISHQRITRLTPLATVLARIEARVGAVVPQKTPLAAALGQVLAEDIVVQRLPPSPTALRDGYAVDAATVSEAGPYMPVALPAATRRIDAGEPMPNGCDAVLPVDAVALRGGRIEAVAAVTAGGGVLPAGDDAMPGTPLRRAGEKLRAVDIAVLHAAGVAEIMVRAPSVGIVRGGTAHPDVIEAAREMLILVASLDYEKPDLLIAVGGTGSGRQDDSVRILAQYGAIEAHGIAVAPGETAAVGFVGTRPVLLVPGRLDAALAVWLLIGRHIVARLAGGKVDDMPVMMPLKRKLTSPIGLTEVVAVSCVGGMAEPLASGYLSLTALARSDGWIVVSAESEGFAAGTQVAVRAWP